MRAQQARDQSADADHELVLLAERLGLPAEPAAEPLDPAAAQALRDRIERLGRRREQLGPVNPLAKAEYDEALAHVTELESQRGDLETALRELRALIRDTDRQIHETFEETFQAAARNFEELAQHLFPGGRGRLRLVKEDSGITGFAGRPAGGAEKRVRAGRGVRGGLEVRELRASAANRERAARAARAHPRHRPPDPRDVRGDLRGRGAQLRGARRAPVPRRARAAAARQGGPGITGFAGRPPPAPRTGAVDPDAAAEAEAGVDGEPKEEELLGVEIEITPAGKSMKRLTLLSGGEKSMTAIGFLFAVFLAKPCPFYILDEVEAALDDPNITRFLDLLRRYADRAQFIVVTHQKRTMEAADTLYGVSMGDDGVSKVISRRLPREDPRRGGRARRRRRVAGPPPCASAPSPKPTSTRCWRSIADYQRFYAGTARDDAHNAAFFGRFVAPSERGMLIAAYDDDAPDGAAPAGYACLYWTYSSVSATDVVLMNDLYVRPERRGGGVGEALVAATVDDRPRARRLTRALVHRAGQPPRAAPLRARRRASARRGSNTRSRRA